MVSITVIWTGLTAQLQCSKALAELTVMLTTESRRRLRALLLSDSWEIQQLPFGHLQQAILTHQTDVQDFAADGKASRLPVRWL